MEEEILQQMSLWDYIYPKKTIDKPIRLIEFFAGIGSQFKALKQLTDKGCVVANTLIVGGNSQYKSGYSLSGQIVAKFTLNKVDVVWKTINEEHPKHLLENSCLSFEKLHSYLNGSIGYAWQIDDLEIFNELKELRGFKKTNKFGVPQYEFGNGTCDYKKIKTAPQSWCYIEVEE